MRPCQVQTKNGYYLTTESGTLKRDRTTYPMVSATDAIISSSNGQEHWAMQKGLIYINGKLKNGNI